MYYGDVEMVFEVARSEAHWIGIGIEGGIRQKVC